MTPLPLRRADLAARAAGAMLVMSGLLSFGNSTRGELAEQGVDIAALRAVAGLAVAVGVATLCLAWRRRPQIALLLLLVPVAVALLGVGDLAHHYSRAAEARAVYPVFVIMVLTWSGLLGHRGLPLLLALPIGGVLVVTFHESDGTNIAIALVTVPAAIMTAELVAWSMQSVERASAQSLAHTDSLRALIDGTTRLQHAMTAEEIEQAVTACAAEVLGATNVVFTVDQHRAVAVDEDIDITVTTPGRIRVALTGQAGTIGYLDADVPLVDEFTRQSARLLGDHLGTRLEQLRVIDALTQAASTDALTGVRNRRGAQSLLENLQPGVSLLLVDIDHFKELNDRDGHLAGDALLAALGEHLAATVRHSDHVARYGGDEFVVLAEGTPEQATELAGRLLAGWRSRRCDISLSIGIATHEPGEPPIRTFQRADTALYEAKRRGRDRLEYAAATPH